MIKRIYSIIGILAIIISLIPIIWFFIFEFVTKDSLKNIIFNSGIWILIPFVIALIMGIVYLRFGRNKLEINKISDWSLGLFILGAGLLLIFAISGFFISLNEEWKQIFAIIYLITGFLIFLIAVLLLVIYFIKLRKSEA